MTKKTKEKKYVLRNFILELKRVRWPSAKTSSSSFWKIIVFVLIFMGIFFVITLVASILWTSLGVGLE
ncbi:preprotein translocase subunit SecE [Mycoplasma iguanae]|uniref:Preprotein translocase subunit SecE n=1 Tax=Mycoplasma iguanae TaxID=292461 RepID=A0ABY5R9I7_9MOLU|nr:preprotein translocase subunit SecE [Mycoplasma iguanae]UVD81961.1 preprotein translocase subunit SecE [Mycoplasma iguanae]